jgi:hypothetical protein
MPYEKTNLRHKSKGEFKYLCIVLQNNMKEYIFNNLITINVYLNYLLLYS